ncbi:hypothetical protein Drose_27480 [Dactylosporangium roseum]|uniref:ABC transporter permease n=1 Tax=Dactylosporangium roseum TaxID=47989 RepID=A0ABY5YYT1_9ACTN|nr:hypothetical protein [Dactylosporangium roseum]UWZ34898.1 hypothetical protein Drose_27480 [Dactylosporangium roseum]
MTRILAIARLQALGRRDGLMWPLVIIGIAFTVNLAVFAAAGNAIEEQPVTGGLASIYIAALAFGAIAVTQQFPFALGMSVTRREFAISLGLFVLAQSLVFSVLLVICQAVEDATDGWGMRLRFFGMGFVNHHGVFAQLLIYAAPMLLMSLIGISFGAVYIRWNVNGVFATVAALILVPGGVAALVTYLEQWSAIGSWLIDRSALTLYAALPAAVVALLALAAWTTLRRATT